jgi:hypothetical protein
MMAVRYQAILEFQKSICPISQTSLVSGWRRQNSLFHFVSKMQSVEEISTKSGVHPTKQREKCRERMRLGPR